MPRGDFTIIIIEILLMRRKIIISLIARASKPGGGGPPKVERFRSKGGLEPKSSNGSSSHHAWPSVPAS